MTTRQLESIFADHQVASYVRVVRGVRRLDGQTAMLHAVVGRIPPAGGDVMPDRHAIQLLVGRREGDRWLAVSFQNTPAQLDGQPGAVEALTQELRAARATMTTS